MSSNDARVPYRVGQWLPSDQATLEGWLKRRLERAIDRALDFHPTIVAFQDFIESDPRAYMWFHQMFDQVPRRYPYNQNPDGDPQVRNYMEMLVLMNDVLQTPPEYSDAELVGFLLSVLTMVVADCAANH